MTKARATKILLLLGVLALLLVVMPNIAGAQTFDIKKGIVGNIACAVDGSCGFCDWIDLFVVLQKVILSLFGGVALIMMVWAGQGLITAAGNETKISESKKLMGTTIIGILVVLAGYFLVNVLIGILLTPSGTTTGLKTAVNGSAWAQAYCRLPSDQEFCKNRTDGTPCVAQGGKGYCQAKACITACKYKLGASANSTYDCRSITSCTKLPTGTNEEKLAACTGTEADGGTNECARFLCPGGNDQVCCQ